MDTRKNVGAIIALIVGVSVATLSLIFVGVLGGQTYQLNEPQINTVGIHTQGPVPSTWTFRVLYDNQQKHTQRNWFTMPDKYNNGTIAFYHNSTVLTTAKFLLHATNGTVKIADATYNGTDVSVKYTYDNSTMRNYIKAGAVSAFVALSETGGYLPIIVLAVIITLVLGMVMGFAGFRKPGESSGGAL